MTSTHAPASLTSPLANLNCDPAIPAYLQTEYGWAYVHPNAVRLFEREWLINLILFGHYGLLRRLALAELGPQICGQTLQVACVYGNLTQKLIEQLAPEGKLKVVDILPIQLDNLAHKLQADPRVSLERCNAASLTDADASQDQVLLFFLLHEQPADVRRATLREALRVVKPGGKIVIIDYHKPHPMHPLKPLIRLIFRYLEPFAMDLWEQDIEDFLPQDLHWTCKRQSSVFGGLYQLTVIQR
jgi:ubiquinone/menaquinone biosynthesis C-methylase UbiE